MKIGIISYFKSRNIGDILIAEQIISLLPHNCNPVLINISGEQINSGPVLVASDYGKKSLKTVFLSLPVLSDLVGWLHALYSKRPEKIYSIAENLDVILFAGGNQIMELKSIPSESLVLRRIVTKLKTAGKTVCFLYSGIGPFKSQIGKTVVKRIFRSIDFLSVRDEKSKELALSINPDCCPEIWRDPVLLRETVNVVNSDKVLGINVYFGCTGRKKNAIKAAYINLIEILRESMPGFKILLFSTELNDYKDVEIIQNETEYGNVETVYLNSVDEAMTLFESVSCVFAMRMHSIIMSMISFRPVVAVAWQEKVSALMNSFGLEKSCFSVDGFISETRKVVEAIKLCYEDRFERVKKTSIALRIIRDEQKDLMKNYISSLSESETEE